MRGAAACACEKRAANWVGGGGPGWTSRRRQPPPPGVNADVNAFASATSSLRPGKDGLL